MAKTEDPWSSAGFDDDFVRGARVRELSADERAKEAKTAKKAIRKVGRRRVGRRAIGIVGCVAVVAGVMALAARQSGPVNGATATLPSAPGAGAPQTSQVGRTTTIGLKEHDYPTGSCVTWEQNVRTQSRDVRTVSCDSAHLMEMVGDTSIPQPWSDGPFPVGVDMYKLTLVVCKALVEKYLGRSIDPAGFVRITSIRPSEEGWLRRDRAMHCAITAGAVSKADVDRLTQGMDKDVIGSLRNASTRYPWSVGDCLIMDRWRYRVSCEEPHSYEFVGWGDVTGEPALPDRSDLVFSTRCGALADAYVPSTPPSISVWNDILEPDSWDAGERSFACFLGARERDSAGLPVKTVGSVRVIAV